MDLNKTLLSRRLPQLIHVYSYKNPSPTLDWFRPQLDRCIVYFPQIGIGASEKRASPESEKELKLTCVAVSCGGSVNDGNINARMHMSHPTTISCSRHGRPVTCENLELLRLRVPLAGQPDSAEADFGTVLISHGAVLPAVAEIMTGMNIIQSSKNELIVSVPRSEFSIWLKLWLFLPCSIAINVT